MLFNILVRAACLGRAFRFILAAVPLEAIVLISRYNVGAPIIRRAISRASGFVIATALALAAASALPSCVPSRSAAASTAPTRPQSGLATATLRSGSVEILVELAISDREQETGLMHRKELADGKGMLFIYGEDRRMSFWMKNTLIPLSIAYIGADGVIKEIHDMEALSLAPVEGERYARYALEAPLGWFARAGLSAGDRFDLSGVPGIR